MVGPDGRADRLTHPMQELAAYFGTESVRTDERSVSSRLAVHDGLRDWSGALRMGAIAYTVDGCTGLAMGLAVLERDLWVVTTDLHVDLIAPVVEGPLRIDAEVVRAGATTAVSTFTLHDEGTGDVAGGGTCTARPFPFEFEGLMLDMPVGGMHRYGSLRTGPSQPLVRHLGFRVGEDGGAEVDAGDWLRNPWGILHGGVTACLAEAAAEVAGSAALARPARVMGELVRYLAPVRVGPARATPQVVAVHDGRALVEVRVVDAGADDRLMAVVHVTVG